MDLPLFVANIAIMNMISKIYKQDKYKIMI